MTDLAFFKRGLGITVGEIAALTGAVASANVPLDRRINGIAPLDRAGPRDLTFIDSAKYTDQYAESAAGACLASSRLADQLPAGVPLLTLKNPYSGFVTVAQKLFPGAARPSSLFETDGHSDDAAIHPSARFENGVIVEPGAVIGPRVELGENSLIGATAVIGADVKIGRDCVVAAGAVVTHALIGDRVIVHTGCRIGQDGFGYTPGPAGLRKIPQIGRVIIQNDVEIGANTTIDRGGTRDTVIGEGTKIDNLVQIAHNVVIGRHCIIVSQTGISGSVTVGDRAVFGGQVGIVDNVSIGEGAKIAARGAAMSDVPPGVRWGGSPARPVREWLRSELVRQHQARRNIYKDDKDTEE